MQLQRNKFKTKTHHTAEQNDNSGYDKLICTLSRDFTKQPTVSQLIQQGKLNINHPRQHTQPSKTQHQHYLPRHKSSIAKWKTTITSFTGRQTKSSPSHINHQQITDTLNSVSNPERNSIYRNRCTTNSQMHVEKNFKFV